MAVLLIPTTQRPKRTLRRRVRQLLHEYRGFVFIFLVAAVLIVFYLALLIWADALGSSVENIKVQKASLLANVQTQAVTNTREFARRARAVQGVVGAHKLPSQLLFLIEEATHKSVILRALHFDVDTATLELQGIAPSFEILGEQFVIWKNAAVFAQDVSLDDFKYITTGQITFTATMQVKRVFLQ